uniref:Uncharacterized protein n=1 Tax=Physcomitrium patens TaxID=3218 RepID=A0A2K1JPN3_PHYPA|nr:hypothetical protein PHYPA_015880 [Physcomitrium patens]
MNMPPPQISSPPSHSHVRRSTPRIQFDAVFSPLDPAGIRRGNFNFLRGNVEEIYCRFRGLKFLVLVRWLSFPLGGNAFIAQFPVTKLRRSHSGNDVNSRCLIAVRLYRMRGLSFKGFWILTGMATFLIITEL